MYVLAQAVNLFFRVVYYMIFIRIIMSWFIRDPRNKFYMILVNVTEPILLPFRKLSYKIFAGRNMMIDISPLLAIIALQVINNIVIRVLVTLAI